MRIRKATQQDLHSIMQLYENARAFMREHGNPGQWGTTYPPQNMIETDIRFGNLYGIFTMWKFKDRYARKQYRYAEYAEEKRIYLLRTHLYRQWRRTACIPKRLPSTLRSLLKLFF